MRNWLGIFKAEFLVAGMSLYASCVLAQDGSLPVCTKRISDIKVSEYSSFKPGAPANLTDDAAACFGWETLLALSIPARFGHRFGENHLPASNGKAGPTIWEKWQTIDDVLFPGTDRCEIEGVPYPEVLSIKDVLSEDFHPAKFREKSLSCMHGTLVDQNSERVWFETSLNPVIAEQIHDKNWHLQTPAAKDVKFNLYSMIFRTAWVKATEDQDESEFYIRDKGLFHEDTGECEEAAMALVGINIWLKTNVLGEMFWLVFEHVRNTPSFYEGSPDVPIMGGFTDWTFFDEECEQCERNKLDQDSLPSTPTQVVRETSILGALRDVNKYWEEELKGSVWKNYILVGSQWGRGAGNVWSRGHQQLASSVLDTSCQSEVPVTEDAQHKWSKVHGEAYQGCVNCHGDYTHFITYDNTFIFHRSGTSAHSVASAQNSN